MWGLKAEIDTCISNVDEVCNVFIIGYQSFKITLWYMIRSWGKQTVTFL